MSRTRRSARRAARLSGALCLCLALHAGAQEEPPGAAPSGSQTWYAQALARGEAGLNVTHFWSKGPMLRAETVVAGHRVVTIVKDDWYYAYDALSNQGVAIRRDPAAIARAAKEGRPFGNEYRTLLEQGAELVREEEVLGRKTGVFRVTDDRGQRELWVTLDAERLPLRVEIYDRRRASRRYTDYVNWQSGLRIPDSFFEPEQRVALERVELEEYFARTLKEGPVGPVPVLYARLLSVRRDE
jgi:outer membrane lipoprotein-sorting protein